MRKLYVLTMALFAVPTANAIEPLQADLNPSNYVPYASYYDTGSGQHFYYDNTVNTFFITSTSDVPKHALLSEPNQPATTGDPTGMLSSVNSYRASRGLHPWVFDGYLYNAAINNNAWQRIKGMGHHDVPSAQNSAWGAQDVISVLNMWTVSAGHAATLYGGYTAAAIAFDGIYWTLNAR
jgi:uncharacterized protein YkwD